jgi:hypothetical protein
MARRQHALLALALALGLCGLSAVQALDCSSISGCTDCSRVTKRGTDLPVLVCRACAAPAYVLKRQGVCACAPGFATTTSADGTGSCKPEAPLVGAPAAPLAPLKPPLPAPQQLSQQTSQPSQLQCPTPTSVSFTNWKGESRCMCKPGYYLKQGGLAPACAPCSSGLSFTYNDEPNIKSGCKVCPIGFTPTADRTACGELPLFTLL